MRLPGGWRAEQENETLLASGTALPAISYRQSRQREALLLRAALAMEGPMTESDQRNPKNPQALLPQPFLDMQRPTLSAMAEVSGKLYEGIAAMNKEWTLFINRRLKEDLGMPEQLAACATTEEMFRTYADYVRTAWTDYQSGLEQMSRLNSSLAQQTLSALQSHVNRAVTKSSGDGRQTGGDA